MQTRAAPWAEHRARRAAGHVAARRATRGRPRRRGGRDARQERLHRLQPAREPVRRGRRRRTARRRLPPLPDVPRDRPTGAIAPARAPRPLRRRRRPARPHAQARLPRGAAPRRAARRARARAAGHAEAARAEAARSATTRTRSRSARSCSPWPRPRSSSATCASPACGASPPTRSPTRTPSGRSCARRGARGFAVEREEFDDDFCCIAAPVLDARGRFLAVIGISMSRRAFDDEHEILATTVVDVAAVAGRDRGGPARWAAERPRTWRRSALPPRPEPVLSSHLRKRRSILIRAVPRA